VRICGQRRVGVKFLDADFHVVFCVVFCVVFL
jgi:hypothetical protein